MKTKKIAIIAILFILITISIMPISNATIDPENYKPNDITLKDTSTAFIMARKIFSSILTVGIVVSVVTIMFLGIKYMLGSVEEKAEYKKTMIPILVGMIMLFCASTIVSIIYSVMQNFD